MPDSHQPDAFSEVNPSEQETIARKIELPAELLEANSPGGEVSPPAASLQGGARSNKTMLWGGIGCILLLCVGLLGGVGLMTAGTVFWGDFNNNAVAAAATTEPVKVKITSSTNKTGSPHENQSGDPVSPTKQPDVSVEAGTPVMGEIKFAPKTDPLRVQNSFKTGVVTILATFEYNNLSPDDTWTQVWYHDSQEISRSTQPWLEGESGVYEYVIETGQGPLPEGQWDLEFYINEHLVTSGSFEISGEGEARHQPDPPEPVEVAKVFKLAYTKWDGEKHNLYVSDSNGSYEQFILRGGAGPSWSPDGQHLFFYGEEGVDHQYINGQRYSFTGVTNGIVRLDASPLPANVSQLNLAQGHGWNDGTARWANVSPDGSMIAYDGDRGGGRRVYFLGTNSNQQFRYEIIGEQADWSPDSQQIVYRSGRNNQTGLWISNRTDSGHMRLTVGGANSFPAWSPDGNTIAFSRDVGGNVDIYTVKPDGSELTQLTNAPGHDTLPEFLPTGEIVFRSARGGQWNIWKMDGDGSNQTLIIANAPVGPEWSFSRMGVLQ